MGDADLIRRFLRDYPSALEMTKLCEPQVVVYDGPIVEDSGVSGFVIIAESHISIHTFPRRNYVNVDVFSCKSFDNERAVQDIKKLFSLKDVRTWVLDRGLEHLDNQDAVPLHRAEGPSIQAGRHESHHCCSEG